ncbi:LANO_0B07426g1_1 [Lachancea nothofagi CBS 11611]|uniref:LANO_0B07426g1_1 n=1 Tax=Lachancea nothofagi CBS 11611 TaxID=1266666 RepID=A0A1G4J094_9SACH|nr:LANO_0B07426g1_1 [Lachancea nothofagi CBS 11611]
MVRTEKYHRSTNACVEIENGPFGISSINFKANEPAFVGIGSCTSRLNGRYSGVIHYNNELELSNRKFKLYCVIDESACLRIDFIEIALGSSDEKVAAWKDAKPEDADYEVPALVYQGSRLGSPDNQTKPFVGVLVFGN